MHLENSEYRRWLASDDYFDALAILSTGPLHPGRGSGNSILAEMQDWEGARVLDIGAGTGWSHRYFSQLGAHYHSVEPNQYMRDVALRSGVPENELTAAEVADIDTRWLEKNGPFDCLMLQGIIGFLENGIESIRTILTHSSLRQVVLVDWVGTTQHQAGAPVETNHKISSIADFFETSGFGKIDVQTFYYADERKNAKIDVLFDRVCSHFIEASEIGRKDEVMLKYKQHLYHNVKPLKRYVVLIAQRDEC